MPNKVLTLLASEGLLLEPDAVELVMEQPDPMEFARHHLVTLKECGTSILNRDSIRNIIESGVTIDIVGGLAYQGKSEFKGGITKRAGSEHNVGDLAHQGKSEFKGGITERAGSEHNVGGLAYQGKSEFKGGITERAGSEQNAAGLAHKGKLELKGRITERAGSEHNVGGLAHQGRSESKGRITERAGSEHNVGGLAHQGRSESKGRIMETIGPEDGFSFLLDNGPGDNSSGVGNNNRDTTAGASAEVDNVSMAGTSPFPSVAPEAGTPGVEGEIGACTSTISSGVSFSPERIEPLEGYSPEFLSLEPQVEVIREITGNSLCEGKKEDFFGYFKSRFNTLKGIIKHTYHTRNLMPMEHLKRGGRFRPARGEHVTIIGMVTDVRTTKNGHTLIKLDDETGTATAMIIDNGGDRGKYNVVLDETVALVGNMARDRDLFYVDRLLQPGVPWGRTVNHSQEDVCAVFISDIHAGSNTFLEKQWLSFLKWLGGGSSEHLDMANRVKYLVLGGDNVDGIGVYPNHKYDLAVSDIYEQYRLVGKYLSMVPGHIQVIMIPGNHDAVRRAEPQPAVVEDLVKDYPANVKFLGSPASFTLHGVNVLAYHGTSIDDWITAMNHLTYSNPLLSMREMLTRRHMLPMYGMKTPLAPEKDDHMIIDPVPDIFLTGHTHSFGVEVYKKILLINGSTWQSQTDYQKMHNFDPNPAKATVVNLRTLQHRVLDFSSGVPVSLGMGS